MTIAVASQLCPLQFVQTALCPDLPPLQNRLERQVQSLTGTIFEKWQLLKEFGTGFLKCI